MTDRLKPYREMNEDAKKQYEDMFQTGKVIQESIEVHKAVHSYLTGLAAEEGKTTALEELLAKRSQAAADKLNQFLTREGK